MPSRPFHSSAGAALVVAWGLTLTTPSPSDAQYFGQNKVQYEQFDFQILRTRSLDVYHYPEIEPLVRRIAPLAEQWRLFLGDEFGYPIPGRQPIVLYASHPHFVQTHVIEGRIGEGTGGVTEGLRRRIAMPFAWTLGETSHVLGHELVHAFQYGADAGRVNQLPLWFVEGMAEYLSLGDEHAPTAMWLRDAVAREDVPSLEDLSSPRYFPYRYGHAAWAYLGRRFGPEIVGRAFLEAARAGDVFTGLEIATGVPADELSASWQAAVRERHGTPGRVRSPGRVLVEARERTGMLNVGPALSPDGRWLAYLSERDGLAIDLFVTEVATGRVVHRVTSAAVDPHLESLQFVGSAGAWDPGSRRLAYTSVRQGKATMSVVEIGDGVGLTREFPLDAVSDAWHPTWAPDGTRIAFAGQAGGASDLFELTLASGQLRRLTSDAYADLQPAWSPDGERLAFVTDRFSSSLDDLAFGSTRLATLTLATASIEPLPRLADGPHSNPQWTADGRALLFLGAPNGIANLYRLDLPSRAFRRLTDVTTGVSGISALSPALSYASGAGRAAFTVFTGGGYAIHLLEAAELNGEADGPSSAPSERASVLFGPTPQELAPRPGTLGSPTPPRGTATVEPYRPRLALDAVGAAAGVGGSGRQGVFFGGGLGLRFSDMLGRHVVSTFVMANGGVRDIGGQVLYLNRTRRWNWGASALYQPYATGQFSQMLQSTPSGPVVVDDELVFRQDEADLRLLTAYPFSRALRLEFQGGGRRLWFDQRATRRVFDAISGNLLDEDTTDLGSPAPLTLGDTAAALVYDQTVFGPTGPLVGQRYRFEVAPTFGSLRFTGVTADYRRYIEIARPVTLAVRALHVGRYGGDAEDARLPALFLGYPTLVRGYEVDSFSADECGVAPSGCFAFDRLLGSRLAVGNVELRVPLFGAFTRQYHYGPLPVEAFVFGDAGVAWTAASGPELSGEARRAVTSAGAGLRINLFGAAIGQVIAARPFDRPGRGWTFAFHLLPGF
jgi:Omp85 superfamily domain/Peptidase of plants and bacteria/WD40-like Beta Propeller Repeat